MKKTIVLFLLFFICFFNIAFSQSAQEMAVEKNVTALKKAMIDADSIALDQLTATELSYGHSSGHVEGKQEFISKIVSGKSDFVTMELTNQTITVADNIALVRHKLDAAINDNGKAGEVHLFVLLIWQKQRNGWKLLARQATKQPVQ